MPPKKKQAEKTDKRYRAKVTIPGVDKPVWVAAKTKAALEEEKRRVKEEYVAGPQRKDMPFVDLIREWWEIVKLPRIRRHGTLVSWEMILRNYVFPFFPPRKLCRAVTRRDLQRCLDQTAGMSANYSAIIKSCLTNACRYAVAENILPRDPSVLLTRPQPKATESRRAFTRAEEALILEAAHNLGGLEEQLVLLLYYTGVRIGEAAGLRWEDVLWQKGLLHVRRSVDTTTSPMSLSDTKSASGDRYIPLPDVYLFFLRQQRGLPMNYVLGNGAAWIRPPVLERRMHRVMDACGFVFSPHYFRHHFVTSYVQADFRSEYVMTIAGHASYGTTIRIYTHIQQQMLEDDFQRTRLSEILESNIKVAKRLPEKL